MSVGIRKIGYLRGLPHAPIPLVLRRECGVLVVQRTERARAGVGVPHEGVAKPLQLIGAAGQEPGTIVPVIETRVAVFNEQGPEFEEVV